MKRVAFLARLATILAVASPVAAQPIITDGDTIKLNGTTYGLWGIDAPEKKQWCGDYPAGVLAGAALETLMKGRGQVECERKDTDRYGRTVAIRRVDGRDLGKAMVQLGMARAFTRYSVDYVAEEERAKRDRLGVHGQGCVPAWEWRAAQRRSREHARNGLLEDRIHFGEAWAWTGSLKRARSTYIKWWAASFSCTAGLRCT